MMRKKIFLTGGSGFIGKNILEQLGSKYQFYAPTHHELDLINTQAVDKYCQKHQFDLLIHTANVGGNRREEQIPDIVPYNFRIFANLLKNRKHCQRMIILGSGAEFGKQQDIVKVAENDFGEIIPSDDFGLYKYLCAYIADNTKQMLNLRLFGIFGKYEDYHIRFISNAICKTIFGQPIRIWQNVVFDYIYVDDFVKILEHFIQKESKYHTYNIGSEKPIDLLTISQKVVALSPRKVDIIIDKAGYNHEYTSDNSRLRREITNLEFSNFDNSIKKLFTYYQSIKDTIDPTTL